MKLSLPVTVSDSGRGELVTNHSQHFSSKRDAENIVIWLISGIPAKTFEEVLICLNIPKDEWWEISRKYNTLFQERLSNPENKNEWDGG